MNSFQLVMSWWHCSELGRTSRPTVGIGVGRRGPFFLTHLAEEQKLTSTGQNQCFDALLFFFWHVRGQSYVDFQGATRAKTRQRVPVVLSAREVTHLLELLPTKFR
jgi:hypothetical protein